MRGFAANLGFMFTEVPFLDRIAAAARAGFQAVEFLVPFDTPADAIAARLQASGVVNVGFNMHPGDWAAGERGLAAIPGREAEFRRSVDQALAYADALGTRAFHPLAGIVPAGADSAPYRAVYTENVAFAARQAAAHGRGIVMETLNTRDMPGYFLTRWSDADAICQEIGEPNVTWQMDLYHTQIAEGDLVSKLRQYRHRISHIQIAGVPDRHEPDEGEVDYRYVLAVLDELGYDGWVSGEYRPRGRTEDGLNWRAALTR